MGVMKRQRTEPLEMQNVTVFARMRRDLYLLCFKRPDVVTGRDADPGTVDDTVYLKIDAGFDLGPFLNPIFFQK